MGKILANQLLSKTLKICPKSNQSPNLVTLVALVVCVKHIELENSISY